MEKIIIEIVSNFGYLGIALLIAIENIFPPIPSELILTFGGFMTTYSDMKIVPTIIVATIGSIVGAIALYMIGLLLDHSKIMNIFDGKVGKILRLKSNDLVRAKKWFNNRGYFAVFICRFIPIIRSIISIPCGMVKMQFSIFVILTAIGTLIWNTLLIILGAAFGNSWSTISNFLKSYSNVTLIILIFLFCIFVIAFCIRQYNSKKNK